MILSDLKISSFKNVKGASLHVEGVPGGLREKVLEILNRNYLVMISYGQSRTPI